MPRLFCGKAIFYAQQREHLIFLSRFSHKEFTPLRPMIESPFNIDISLYTGAAYFPAKVVPLTQNPTFVMEKLDAYITRYTLSMSKRHASFCKHRRRDCEDTDWAVPQLTYAMLPTFQLHCRRQYLSIRHPPFVAESGRQ